MTFISSELYWSNTIIPIWYKLMQSIFFLWFIYSLSQIMATLVEQQEEEQDMEEQEEGEEKEEESFFNWLL